MNINESVIFYLLSAISIISALLVVTVRNLVRAIVYLALFFLSIAGLYITLNAEFLAVVQVFIYVGAVIVLFLFLIMLTGRITDMHQPQHNRQRLIALFTCLLLLLLIVWIFSRVVGTGCQITKNLPLEIFGIILMRKYLLPFELISVVLLVALVGALFIARKDKKDG